MVLIDYVKVIIVGLGFFVNIGMFIFVGGVFF